MSVPDTFHVKMSHILPLSRFISKASFFPIKTPCCLFLPDWNVQLWFTITCRWALTYRYGVYGPISRIYFLSMCRRRRAINNTTSFVYWLKEIQYIILLYSVLFYFYYFFLYLTYTTAYCLISFPLFFKHIHTFFSFYIIVLFMSSTAIFLPFSYERNTLNTFFPLLPSSMHIRVQWFS